MSLTRRDFIQMSSAAVAAHVLAPAGASAAETPQRGGVFRIRGEDATTGFDPHLAPNHHRIATNLSFTHSRLVKVKAGPSVVPGTLPVEPDLAESWSQPNDRTYVFKLRKGVRWHPKPPVNGRELTADDVKYTYDRFLQIKGNPNRSMLGHVEKIDVLDRYAVKFTLSEPFGWFLDYLANTVMWIVPREAVEQFGDLRRAEACIGTGPWMLERYEPNTRLIFVRHKDYFVPGLPYADGVEVTVDEDPSSRMASWIAGKYDFAPEYGQCVRRLDLPVAHQRRPGLRTQDFIVLFGAYTAIKLDRKFDKLGHGLRGGSPIADISLYNSHIPGEPLNASGVDDPKLTEMIRLQRRTLDVAKRREIVYDIQRYLAEQVYYAYGPSVSAVAAWDPRVKNFAPNIGHDYGGRLMGAWLSG